MKKVFLGILALLIIITGSAPSESQAQSTGSQNCMSGIVPLYGLTKPNGRHFYTTQWDEVAQVMQYNYRFDGVLNYINAQPVQDALPVHRYFNASTGAHRYFASESVNVSYGTHEGIMGYISQTGNDESALYFAADDSINDVVFYTGTRNPSGNYSRAGLFGYTCGTGDYFSEQNALYRYYNPKSGKHFYTTSKTEGDGTVKSLGFKYEGLAGYVFAVKESDSQSPIYRLYNPSINKHFYTTNESEKNALTTNGYRFEGTIGYTAGVKRGLSMHRLYNSKTNDHLWTVDNLEADRAQKSGYVKESALGDINPHSYNAARF